MICGGDVVKVRPIVTSHFSLLNLSIGYIVFILWLSGPVCLVVPVPVLWWEDGGCGQVLGGGG